MSETIEKISISNAMSKNFLDYAMSVIVDRALPNISDGLGFSPYIK